MFYYYFVYILQIKKAVVILQFIDIIFYYKESVSLQLALMTIILLLSLSVMVKVFEYAEQNYYYELMVVYEQK